MTSAHTMSSSLKSPSVVVVGAGVAGVSAALSLIHNGIDDVVILEAQDYIGGRVKAVSIGNVLRQFLDIAIFTFEYILETHKLLL